ncbi:Factor of DNA methylation 3 [Bienertia sinuspersici]
MKTSASPPTCIIHNLPKQYDEQGKPIAKSFVMIRDLLRDLGYKVKKFIPAWNHCGFKGYDSIEFGLEDEDFKQALKLERKFHQKGHSKAQWMSRNTDAWPYLWAAMHNDRHLLNRNRVDFKQVPNDWRVQANREAEADILDAFGTIKIWPDNMINNE